MNEPDLMDEDDGPKIAEMKMRLSEEFGAEDEVDLEAEDGEDETSDVSEDAADQDDGDEADSTVTTLQTEFATALRMLEALLFAASEPLDEATLLERLPTNVELPSLIAELEKQYETRGVHLVRVGKCWQFRTASDLAFLMEKERVEPKKLSRAAIETLAIIAYHQPITRAEIEQIRGVTVSKGTLDVLLETGWVRLRGRRRTPGRPICYGTSQDFLEHFGLENIKDLPGLEDLSAQGLLSANLPAGFSVPVPDEDDSELDPVGEGEDDDIASISADLDADEQSEELATANHLPGATHEPASTELVDDDDDFDADDTVDTTAEEGSETQLERAKMAEEDVSEEGAPDDQIQG